MPSLKNHPKIFIAYRRDDSAGHTGRLYDRLNSHFGPGRIFIDIDTIQPGEDFVSVLEKAVSSCAVLVAVIGRYWLSSSDKGGRRIEKPDDFVRIELLTALSRDIPIIPVLVHGAGMPKPEDLPGELESLTRRQAVELSDTRWAYDVSKLVTTLESTLGRNPGVKPVPDLLKEYCAAAASRLRLLSASLGEKLGHIKLSKKQAWASAAAAAVAVAALALIVRVGFPFVDSVNANLNSGQGNDVTNTSAINSPVSPPKLSPRQEWAVKATQQNAESGRVSLREAKVMLKELNLYGGAVDDSVDVALIEAVRRFQELRGLEPDGAMGQRTYQELKVAVK